MIFTMQNHVRPRVMWLPLVLVGSVIFWSLALGLGGMSLSFLGGSSEEDLALQPPPREEPIVVHVYDSVNEATSGAGGNQSQDDGTGRPGASIEDAPTTVAAPTSSD